MKVELNYTDSWLYESHYKIDFETCLKESDFQKSINDYIAFLISNKGGIK